MDTQVTAGHLRPVLADLARVLDGVSPEQEAAPTPCTDFDVAALRRHVVGWLTAFTDGFETPTGDCSDAEAVTVTGTGADQVRSLAARLERVLPDAAAHPLRIGGAEMPGDASLAMMLWEYQVHGWDLARATGQDWTPTEDGLRETLAFAPAMLTEQSQGSAEGAWFGPQVPVAADAPAMDRLVGLSGRDPHWHA